MKALHTIFLIILISTSLIAQHGILVGAVTQVNSDVTLPGVSVYLEGTSYGIATNSKGQYELKEIPAGQYTLVISNVGYFTLKSDITIGEGETVKADFAMIEAITTLSEVTVITGGSLGMRDIPGSVQYISPKELQRFHYTDINRTLRHVPGISIQEEDGFGLRPNIGLRGSGVERSSKITIMEDGILAAPAPYSAPAAYYFPTVGRMQGVEVVKGSSQIKYGPYTTGGAINFISAHIPTAFSGTVGLSGGSFGGRNVHAMLGNSHRNFGYVAEAFQYGSRGFKELDGGGDTGFDKKDYLVRFRVNTDPDARIYQSLTLKAGNATEESDETYLGLTQQDFDQTPLRRYVASQVDEMRTNHKQFTVSHVMRLPGLCDITTTAYRSVFSRNWYKLDKVKNSLGNKIGIASLLESPDAYDDAYAILTGTTSTFEDALEMKANNRSYESQGVQTMIRFDFDGGEVRHEVETSARLHQDEVDRFQWSDYYAMDAGNMKQTIAGIPGTESNTIESATALAAYVQYKLSWRNLTVIPGLRFEHIEMEAKDYGKADPGRTGSQLTERNNKVDVWIPGIGVDYQLDASIRLFAGVHKGFAPPGAQDETAAEESINYEIGGRYARGRLSGQVIGFFNDYDNLLGTDLSAAGGQGTGDLFNGGEVHAKGAELQATYQLLASNPQGLNLPVTIAYTYTDATFLHDFDSDFEGWGQVMAGDELPYLAHHQLSTILSIEHHTFGAHLSGRYLSAMRTSPGQGAFIDPEKTDAYLVFDLGANYKLHAHFSVFASITNLSDQVYIVARRPAGIRPGMPRAFNFGVKGVF